MVESSFPIITLFSLLQVLSAALQSPELPHLQSLSISSPLATIPSFPEQSDLSVCPLDLPDDLFSGVKAACSVGKGKTESDRSSLLLRVRCCPVLAAWAYAAYSETALGRAGRVNRTASYELPLLPDDSETCVDGLQNVLNSRGIELVRPNETCDLFFCFCGIRLRPFSCSEAFTAAENGKLAGDERVKKLETACLGNAGLSGCSKCLRNLHLLKEKKDRNKLSNAEEDRSSKMHNMDCQLMGLTWLLAKDRPAYIHTVSAVLRAIMLSPNDSDPHTCSSSITSYGMPLAVDSSEIDGGQSFATVSRLSSVTIYGLSLCLLYLFMGA